MARHTAKSHKIRKVEILVIQTEICLLGYQRYLDKIEKLQNYSSKLFEVTNCIVIKQLPPCDLEWGYSDNCINQLLTSSNIDNSNVELCLCFIDNPIEYNYFTRDLSEFDSRAREIISVNSTL